MLSSLPSFVAKEADARAFFDCWQHLDRLLRDRLQSHADLAPLAAEYQDMTQRLKIAYEQLLDSLWHPTLTFATTGTTSSGKSALVNLLCGAELMPVSAEEMSAGVVTITHGNTRKLLVHATKGACWECGEGRDLGDEQINHRLETVMRAFHGKVKAIREGRDATAEVPQCPHCELEYPTRIGRNPELIGLPTGCRFRILDLPGLKYIGDEGNARVIRASRDALCFVTYNSEEPDDRKQAHLLEQIIDQVKELGGSPARMLFVLNRIDGVRRDVRAGEDWKLREDAFVEKVNADIRSGLRRHLPEYAEDIERLRLLRLSTKPALIALKLLGAAGPDRTFAAETTELQYNFLLPRELVRRLPRSVEDYVADDFQCVGQALERSSYADQFIAVLKQHV